LTKRKKQCEVETATDNSCAHLKHHRSLADHRTSCVHQHTDRCHIETDQLDILHTTQQQYTQ